MHGDRIIGELVRRLFQKGANFESSLPSFCALALPFPEGSLHKAGFDFAGTD